MFLFKIQIWSHSYAAAGFDNVIARNFSKSEFSFDPYGRGRWH